MSDFFDKAKDLLAENSDTVDDVVDKIAGLVDDKTGGKHKDQVRRARPRPRTRSPSSSATTTRSRRSPEKEARARARARPRLPSSAGGPA